MQDLLSLRLHRLASFLAHVSGELEIPQGKLFIQESFPQTLSRRNHTTFKHPRHVSTLHAQTHSTMVDKQGVYQGVARACPHPYLLPADSNTLTAHQLGLLDRRNPTPLIARLPIPLSQTLFQEAHQAKSSNQSPCLSVSVESLQVTPLTAFHLRQW